MTTTATDATSVALAGVQGQARLLRDGVLDPVELLDLLLERVERLDPLLGAFRTVLAASARRAAEDAARRLRDGDAAPLLGVPVAVKDDQDVAGDVTTRGSLATGARRAARDLVVVQRLREAGAVVLGRTCVPELEVFPTAETAAHGAVRNPWDRGRVAGGSSSGSGAAVAAGLVATATASDGMGSIRIPAAATGLVGLKPTRDRVPWAPDEPHWLGMATPGALTRSVADQALLLDVLSGDAPGAPAGPPAPDEPFVALAARAPGRLRVAVSRAVPPGATTTPWPSLHPEVHGLLDATASLLADAGHDLSERDLPWGSAFLEAGLLMVRGVADDVADLDEPDLVAPVTRGVARVGRLVPSRALAVLQRRRAQHARRLDGVLAEVDVVVTPMSTGPLPRLGELVDRHGYRSLQRSGAWTPFCGVLNATGHPAVSLPVGTDVGGRPLAVQLVAAHGAEALLLQVAQQLEDATRWTDRVPELARA